MNETETKKLMTILDSEGIPWAASDTRGLAIGMDTLARCHDARIAHEQREVIRTLVHALEKRLDGSPWLSDEITPALKAAAPYLCE